MQGAERRGKLFFFSPFPRKRFFNFLSFQACEAPNTRPLSEGGRRRRREEEAIRSRVHAHPKEAHFIHTHTHSHTHERGSFCFTPLFPPQTTQTECRNNNKKRGRSVDLVSTSDEVGEGGRRRGVGGNSSCAI